jgi:elongation factor Tu
MAISDAKMSRPAKSPDIEALVTFLPTVAGGRTKAVLSGYRPNHLVKDDLLTSGYHEYLDQEEVAPGESATARIWFLAPERHPCTMWEGKVISVQEGSRVVGQAVVTKVFNPVLQRPA